MCDGFMGMRLRKCQVVIGLSYRVLCNVGCSAIWDISLEILTMFLHKRAYTVLTRSDWIFELNWARGATLGIMDWFDGAAFASAVLGSIPGTSALSTRP